MIKLLPAQLLGRAFQPGSDRTAFLRAELLKLVQAIGVVGVFHEFVGELSIATGPSMLPTLNAAHDWLVVEKVSVWRNRIEIATKRRCGAGDVVLALSPRNPTQRIIKRVLGMDGDTVPRGHVWLQGDNTLNSTDSRDYGPLPYNMMLGRVVCRIWPPDQIGWVEREVPPPFYGAPRRRR